MASILPQSKISLNLCKRRSFLKKKWGSVLGTLVLLVFINGLPRLVIHWKVFSLLMIQISNIQEKAALKSRMRLMRTLLLPKGG